MKKIFLINFLFLFVFIMFSCKVEVEPDISDKNSEDENVVELQAMPLDELKNYKFDDTKEYKIHINNEVISKATYENVDSVIHKGNIIEIIFDDDVKNIPDNVFYYLTGVENVSLPNGLESIGEFAFKYCDSFLELNVPDTVTTIGKNAFLQCEKLQKIKLSNKLKTLPIEMLKNCINLKSVDIPDGVESIGLGCFSGCARLQSVTIPASVTKIEKEAFNCTPMLETINYNGTKDQWDKIEILNDDFCAPGGMFGKTIKFKDGEIHRIEKIPEVELVELQAMSADDLEVYPFDKTKKYKVHLNNDFLTTINTKSGSNPHYILYVNDNIIELVIDNDVTEINEYFIYSLPNIRKITFPDTLISLNARCLCSDESLLELEIPDSVTTIEEQAFANCGRLKKIKLSKNIKSFPKEMLVSCVELQSLIIPDGVTSLGHNCLANCRKLHYIEIPASVVKISKDAFAANLCLETINYNGTMKQWKEIKALDSEIASDSNSVPGYFTNVTIKCTDGDIVYK